MEFYLEFVVGFDEVVYVLFRRLCGMGVVFFFLIKVFFFKKFIVKFILDGGIFFKIIFKVKSFVYIK